MKQYKIRNRSQKNSQSCVPLSWQFLLLQNGAVIRYLAVIHEIASSNSRKISFASNLKKN